MPNPNEIARQEDEQLKTLEHSSLSNLAIEARMLIRDGVYSLFEIDSGFILKTNKGKIFLLNQIGRFIKEIDCIDGTQIFLTGSFPSDINYITINNRSINNPCENCGQSINGSTRDDKGFMRCNICGFPTP